MKGSNEFIYFLAAGLVILAVLLAAFNIYVYTNPGCCQNSTPGYIQAVKEFPIPQFSASNMIDTKTTDLVNRDVYSGLLFGEDKIIYDLRKSDLQNVAVKFTVASTNEIGNLRVIVNGHVLEDKLFEAGDYKVDIPAELLTDHVIITLEADSSYWKLWAPTLYHLTNASVTFTSYATDSSQFKFYLGDEYNNLLSAKVDLVLTDNVGKLLVDMNGINVWNSSVANLQSIHLDKTNLRLGDNIINFAGEKGSKFSGSATVDVIFTTQYPETLNQSGIVTATQPYTGTY